MRVGTNHAQKSCDNCVCFAHFLFELCSDAISSGARRLKMGSLNRWILETMQQIVKQPWVSTEAR
jgi:hypothetical protein